MVSWNKFPIKEVELSLAKVLRCGQTFRWKNINNVWSFSLDDKVIFLKQDEYSIHYSWIMKEGVSSKDRFDTSSDVLGFVRDYFNLNVNLELLYQDWSHRSSLVKAATHGSAFQRFTGIRILRQDPWETLVSALPTITLNAYPKCATAYALNLEPTSLLMEVSTTTPFPRPKRLVLCLPWRQSFENWGLVIVQSTSTKQH